ncbi:high nitrogen upregulated cytochrome P450 monooxygenase 2 [Mycena polygramma]|nr:high nitrogen upregulated cytochrome P450 monooxygenase 2 [Mycena polygramma]
MYSGLFVFAAALGLINYGCFHKFEPRSANVPLILLAIQPIALLPLVGGPFSFAHLLWSYVAFLGSLTIAVLAYRLSPLHPLAQYPGPAIGKATKLWGLYVAWRGHRYIYHKALHDKYGPYVRTGPNEISTIDTVAVSQILNSGGLDKGRWYEGGEHGSTPPSIISLVGEAHTTKRRVWNRAMTSSSIRDYEPLIVKRVGQLLERLDDQNGAVDLVYWFDLFALDLVGDLAFGGGFEMLREGKDVFGVGERIRAFMMASTLSGQIPWIIRTLHLFPQVGHVIQEFNDFGQGLAVKRMKNGAPKGTKDLWYHLADEACREKEKPTLEISAADGIVAVIAGSDTTASALSSFVWFVLSNPEHYTRLQQELDNVFVEGDDPLDVDKHDELHFLSACINETLRLHPPVPSSGIRQVHLGQSGRIVAGRFIPEGTSVYTPAYSLHHNPEYFSHPDQFIPDRWLPGSTLEKHDKSAFIPFSLGPANCVGQKFARREMLMLLSVLFKSFDLRFADGFDSEGWPRHIHDYFVTTRGPMHLRLTRRHSYI